MSYKIDACIAHAKEIYHRKPDHINIKVCGEEVELEHHFPKVFVNRHRRITGYRVGDQSRRIIEKPPSSVIVRSMRLKNEVSKVRCWQRTVFFCLSKPSMQEKEFR